MPGLHLILRLNAASCLGFGALFAGWPETVAGLLGTMPALAVALLGWGLLANGGHLAWVSARQRAGDAEIIWFSAGDLAWWLGSLGLLAAGVWITAPAGILAAWLVAAWVAGLALAQLWHLGLRRSGLRSAGHASRIVRSWRALPGWVKLWLLALNAAFLGAAVFLPSPLARMVLTAYAASIPVLLAFAFVYGGLVRVMGMGHLICWGPLAGWLAVFCLRGEAGPASLAYALGLLGMCAACLAFDVHDAWRWWRGDRQVIGADGGGARPAKPAPYSAPRRRQTG